MVIIPRDASLLSIVATLCSRNAVDRTEKYLVEFSCDETRAIAKDIIARKMSNAFAASYVQWAEEKAGIYPRKCKCCKQPLQNGYGHEKT